MQRSHCARHRLRHGHANGTLGGTNRRNLNSPAYQLKFKGTWFWTTFRRASNSRPRGPAFAFTEHGSNAALEAMTRDSRSERNLSGSFSRSFGNARSETEHDRHTVRPLRDGATTIQRCNAHLPTVSRVSRAQILPRTGLRPLAGGVGEESVSEGTLARWLGLGGRWGQVVAAAIVVIVRAIGRNGADYRPSWALTSVDRAGQAVSNSSKTSSPDSIAALTAAPSAARSAECPLFLPCFRVE